MKLVIFEQSEPELKWFVYDLIEFSTFYSNHVVIEKTKVEALRFLSETPRLLHICKHFDARALGDNFNVFPY